MKISLQRESLLQALQIISGVIEKKQTRPILTNTLLSADQNRLQLTATDSEIELIGFAALEEISEGGALTAPARKLYDICRALPEGLSLTLIAEGDRLTVQAKHSRFHLATLPAQDFPSIEEKSFPTVLKLSTADLRQLLSRTSFAMGQQDVRHYLNGAVFDIQNGAIECMATDGHRFALSKMEDPGIGSVKSKILLPRKSVLELLRLLNADDPASLSLCINEHSLRVITEAFTFTSKLIHASLPDYHKLIPQKDRQAMVSDRETLRQALIRVSILSHEKFRGIQWELKAGSLKISANNPEREEAQEVLPVDYEGKPVEVSFNVGYLLDVLSAIHSEKVCWSFSNLDEGVLIEPIEEKGSNLYVVMPLLVPQVEQAA